jgi:hypothetical protein
MPDGPLKQVLAATQVRPAAGLRFGGHIVRTNQSLFGVPGLNFTGSPGMTVKRIREEWDLRVEVRRSTALGSPLVIVRKCASILNKAGADALTHPRTDALLGPSQSRRRQPCYIPVI